MKSIKQCLFESINKNRRSVYEGRSIMADAVKLIKSGDMDEFADFIEGIIDKIEQKVNPSVISSVYGLKGKEAKDCLAIIEAICGDIRGQVEEWRDNGDFEGYEEDALACYTEAGNERIDMIAMNSDVDDDDQLNAAFAGWNDLVKKICGQTWN